jgi:hypothetical protein
MFIESNQFPCRISTTTRPQRRKEDDGIDYFFTTQEEFEKDVMEVSSSLDQPSSRGNLLSPKHWSLRFMKVK